jgi:phenylacetate-CoA ligase
MDHIFKDMVNVQEAQIHQALPGQMTIRVVRGHSYGADDERALLAETAKRVGGETEINIEYVQSLPRSATGKLRFVISEVPGAAISESTIVAN